jgi:hypothetical protein
MMEPRTICATRRKNKDGAAFCGAAACYQLVLCQLAGTFSGSRSSAVLKAGGSELPLQKRPTSRTQLHADSQISNLTCHAGKLT